MKKSIMTDYIVSGSTSDVNVIFLWLLIIFVLISVALFGVIVWLCYNNNKNKNNLEQKIADLSKKLLAEKDTLRKKEQEFQRTLNSIRFAHDTEIQKLSIKQTGKMMDIEADYKHQITQLNIQIEILSGQKEELTSKYNALMEEFSTLKDKS